MPGDSLMYCKSALVCFFEYTKSGCPSCARTMSLYGVVSRSLSCTGTAVRTFGPECHCLLWVLDNFGTWCMPIAVL